jgi:N-acetylglucosaminyl-diphospho-decaprenol L-rhamnosyltransferase
MSYHDITVVITTFRSKNKIKECIKSINSECAIINVENSTDISHKQEIEKEFGNVTCILSGENIGYGRGNNIGLKKVKTKYALILNPDTVLHQNTLEAFLASTKEKPNFSIIGPNVIEDKNLLNFPNLSGGLEIVQVNEVKGFAMFLNLSKFKDIGFFDENIFFFLEEIDLCTRLIKKKESIYWCKNIIIFHEGGKSHENIIDDEMELSRNWHWMWSSFYYNKKYNGYVIAVLKSTPKLLTSSIKVIFYLLTLQRKKRLIYLQRLSGLINSILGKKSWYRPNVS